MPSLAVWRDSRLAAAQTDPGPSTAGTRAAGRIVEPLPTARASPATNSVRSTKRVPGGGRLPISLRRSTNLPEVFPSRQRRGASGFSFELNEDSHRMLYRPPEPVLAPTMR